ARCSGTSPHTAGFSPVGSVTKSKPRMGRSRWRRSRDPCNTRIPVASVRQIAANRRNARRSTGPRTPAAKARAARNALRHGLTTPLARDPPASAEIAGLAAALVGRSPNPARLEQARIAAEAEFELRRVRAHRKSLLDRKAAELAARQRDGDQRSEP